ncbi:MAG: hypothetical protein WA419_02380 [Silvibacterium sp.]
MFNRNLFLLLLFASSAAAAQAQYSTPTAPQSGPQPRSQNTGCPWLTQGTAARALGGDVSVSVNVSGTGEGSCRFSQQPGSPHSLEILVSKAALPTCPPDSTNLKGIGNQAARCKRPGSHGEIVEMVSSRVRDRYFTVTLTSREQKGLVKSPDPQDDELEQIAEKVAGSLY